MVEGSRAAIDDTGSGGSAGSAGSAACLKPSFFFELIQKLSVLINETNVFHKKQQFCLVKLNFNM